MLGAPRDPDAVLRNITNRYQPEDVWRSTPVFRAPTWTPRLVPDDPCVTVPPADATAPPSVPSHAAATTVPIAYVATGIAAVFTRAADGPPRHVAIELDHSGVFAKSNGIVFQDMQADVGPFACLQPKVFMEGSVAVKRSPDQFVKSCDMSVIAFGALMVMPRDPCTGKLMSFPTSEDAAAFVAEHSVKNSVFTSALSKKRGAQHMGPLVSALDLSDEEDFEDVEEFAPYDVDAEERDDDGDDIESDGGGDESDVWDSEEDEAAVQVGDGADVNEGDDGDDEGDEDVSDED